MKNLVSTEKMLKHWLKKKVTITTAAVVGFLLMGTAAFGEKILPTPEPVGNKITFEKFEDKDKYYDTGVIYNTGDKITLVENNGVLKITEAGKLKNSSAVRLQEEKDGLRKQLINNGDIEVNLTGQKVGINGVKLLGNANIINNGNIKVNSNSDAAGVLASLTDKYKEDIPVVENNGTIEAISENGTANALNIINKSPAKLKILNNGTLKAEGKNARVIDILKGGVVFENKGSVILSKGTGYAIGAIGSGTEIINSGIISVSGEGKVVSVYTPQGEKTPSVTNTGIIKVTDKTAEELKNLNVNSLFIGVPSSNLSYTGMLTDKNGVAVENEKDVNLAGEIYTSDINKAGKDSKKVVLGKHENTILLGSPEPASIDSIDIVKNAVKVGKETKGSRENEVALSVKSLNIADGGSLALVKDSILKIENAVINKVGENKDGLTLSEGSFLVLENVNADTNIVGADNKGNLYTLGDTTVNGDITVKKIEVSEGKTIFNGEISVPEINIGKKHKALAVIENDSKTNGYFTADSKFTKETVIKTESESDIAVFQINSDGKNALANGDEKITVIGNIDFDLETQLFTENKVINLNNIAGNDLSKAEYINTDKQGDNIYIIKLNNKENNLILEYNKKLLSDFGSELNTVNTRFQVINDKVSQVAKTTEERAKLADKFYSSNIYSETVRAAYDNIKLNEEAVESLARKSEIGKWTAEGKALYSKNEYDRKGIVGDYSSEVESRGLMAAFGYGVNETTTAGIAFSGVKQDVDTATGSADADLFYLGVYGNKVVGNYDFTAGLGYQFGEYEADNNILAGTGDKYDSQTVSGYVQGRYTADLGDGLSVQPKVRLGYTYINQDDAKDSYFGVEDAEISTFDAEAGFDVVKSVQLEKSKVDVKFGASYIRTMGDTDKEFTGRFYGTKASEGFNVLGAELAENVIKFNLGAEVTNENGFFYNGGFTYEFGSNDTEAYGVNVGVGYRF